MQQNIHITETFLLSTENSLCRIILIFWTAVDQWLVYRRFEANDREVVGTNPYSIKKKLNPVNPISIWEKNYT